MATPIRETIARAICDSVLGSCENQHPCDLGDTGQCLPSVTCRSIYTVEKAAAAVLRALDEAGMVVVRKDQVKAPPDEIGLR